MFRVTLEQLSRFKNLQQFFQKGPDGAGQAPSQRGKPKAAAASHKYAHAAQNVSNFGGSSVLTLWRPTINAAKSHVFSLSQHWYVNYVGNVVQSAEAGWQNYPQFYRTTNTAFFIFWTADGYRPGGLSCYNLTCAAFTQLDRSLPIGGAIGPPYSVDGGTQRGFTLVYRLFNGNWWLGFNGRWIGYYRGQQYGSQGMAQRSVRIDYGGETVGTTNWPPMGSGRFAATGAGHAAYHGNIYYFPNNTSTAYISMLTPSQPSPRCYTLALKNNSRTKFGTYFYFGGPGGTGC